MSNNQTFLKVDSTGGADRVIDYLGDPRTSAIRRTTWLTRPRDPKPLLPRVFLEHPLASDQRRSLGA